MAASCDLISLMKVMGENLHQDYLQKYDFANDVAKYQYDYSIAKYQYDYSKCKYIKIKM
jgi:hypothetical protein